jgi:nucleoside-diphosphate-sugar epimerase
MSHVLVTGGTGCIGAATVGHLLRLGVDRVTIAVRNPDRTRLRLWLQNAEDPRVAFCPLDLRDADAITAAVREIRPTLVVHLAALQSPDCEAHPLLGMQVNVGGTEALLQTCAALRGSVERFVFASSAAVYGPRSSYRSPTVAEDAALAPPNRYGVWKLAGENLARLFHERTQIPTVCLRLNTTYGPGRDQGMTSAVTSALKQIALGAARGERVEFSMPYRGRENYHYVDDVGAHFALATTQPVDGFHACNLRGTTVDITEFLDCAAATAAELGMGEQVELTVRDDAPQNLFVCDLDETAIAQLLPDAPKTPLRAGIRTSLLTFADMAARDELSPPQ